MPAHMGTMHTAPIDARGEKAVREKRRREKGWLSRRGCCPSSFGATISSVKTRLCGCWLWLLDQIQTAASIHAECTGDGTRANARDQAVGHLRWVAKVSAQLEGEGVGLAVPGKVNLDGPGN